MHLAIFAQQTGADDMVYITPFYYKYDEDDLERHYRSVIGSAPSLQAFLYTIPARTGNVVSVGLIHKLRDLPNLVGIKDSTGDMVQMLQHLEIPDFQVLSGSDALVGPALLAGAAGVVSGLANVVPEIYVSILGALRDGQMTEFNRLLPGRAAHHASAAAGK